MKPEVQNKNDGNPVEGINRIDSNPVIHLSDIKNNIVQYLNYLHNNLGEYRGVILWVFDPIYEGALDDTFINDLKCELHNHLLDVFANVDVAIGKPEDGVITHEVVKGVELSLIRKNPPLRDVQKAIFTTVSGRGTTVESEYTLDPQNSETRKWFIGRGPVSAPRHSFRENNIIITPIDDESLSEFQKDCNRHVSSAHAYITYNDEENCFYFHQDTGGLKCGSTIEKDQTVSPIRTTQPVRLSNNCYLKLGSDNHHVMFRIKITNN